MADVAVVAVVAVVAGDRVHRGALHGADHHGLRGQHRGDHRLRGLHDLRHLCAGDLLFF